jgi:hypothetical protein
LRELEAICGRIGRSGGSQTDRRCGSDDNSKYFHLFLLWSITPREVILWEQHGFPRDTMFLDVWTFMLLVGMTMQEKARPLRRASEVGN